MPRDAVASATGHGTDRPASAAEISAGPMDHPPAAGLRDLCRPATVVLVLIPLGMLGAGASTGGRLVVVTAIAASALIAAAAVLLGLVPIRHTYSWIAVFAGLLTVSFTFPSVAPPPAPGERHGAVDLVGPLRGMAATDLGRFFDLAGILAGLALLGVSLVTSPHPRRVARVIALSGTTAAAYVLVRGGFDNVRLEGLGCNPNYLGFLLALPAVTALGLVRYARNPRWLVPASVCGLALSETHSRSAFLAAAVGSAIVLLQGHSRLFQGALVSAGAATAIAVAAGGMLRPMGRRIENLGAGGRTVTDLSLSNGLRRRVAEFALQVITDHPLRGIGLSTFPGYAQRSPRFGAYLATHDEYLRLAAEAGVITLILFLVLLWLGLGRRQAGDLALLRAVVLTYTVILLFANPLANLVVSVPFWVSMGCLLASRPNRGVTTAALVAGAVRAVRERRGRTSFVRSVGEGAEPRA
ncbi:O-antigen ligase family protein [Actinoallomurus spadix]|uniref:O-antigen ligase-related domain-containing protein n=1 Tax=Actinoallomurus spadix TaxID=79912 RepID=A0ABN0WZC6_9ACTN|nr:O-antigen ligase family protein [Actinoallomurus spadix]MCO5989107.1 O-antigen ligase family protein [Actinoallomurus spadix]